MTVEHLNAGFARAADLTAADVLTDISGARDLLAIEASAVAHMNDDHADAVALYATKLLGAPDGPWRVIALDPDGLDLGCGDSVIRLDFPQRVTAASQLREVLADLAKRARKLNIRRNIPPLLYAAVQRWNTHATSRLGLWELAAWQRRNGWI
jgi:putative heme iron utilization protein